MAIQILIGGVDYTAYTELPSIKAEANIAVGASKVDLDIVIPDQILRRPKGGQEIKILNGGAAEFAGVIINPKEIALAPTRMQYQIQARDYTFYFDKKLVTNTYANYTAGNIVKDIITNYTSGFSVADIEATDPSYLISLIKFDHVAPSAAIKKLANDAGLQWWIDYNKGVHFQPLATYPSPLLGNLLDVDNDIANYGDLEFDEDVSQVRNQLYLMGYRLPASYSITEKFTGDGQKTSFSLGYEPKHALSSIVVTVGGTPYTPKLDVVDGLPNNTAQDSTAYINYSAKVVRLNVAPASGVIISVTYFPLFETISLYNNPAAMQEMASRDGSDGVYEYAVRDRQLTSVDSTLANLRGQYELAKYGYPHYSGQFTSFLQGWTPGQYFYLTSNARMDGQFQNRKFFVVKVEKEIALHPPGGTPVFFYTVYFSDTPYVY